MPITYRTKRWAPLGQMYVCNQVIVGDGTSNTIKSPHFKKTLFCSVVGEGASGSAVSVSNIINSDSGPATITLSSNLAAITYYVTTIGY